MFTVESKVGRLLEIRGETLRSPTDVERMVKMIRADVGLRPRTESVVICADYRPLTVFADDVAEAYRSMLLQFNPRVARSVILVAKNGAVAQLQLTRLVREAENADRRVVNDPAAARTWLGEVLTPQERARLAEFVGA